VMGTMRNADVWYEDFGVKPGDHMYDAPDQ
jgi:predicted metalloendopeptidase